MVKKIDDEMSRQENIRLIRARYIHEKKKVIFIMYSVRKLRNQAKLKNVYGELSDSLMYAACVLLKKGMLYNQNAINSLKNGDNAFKLKDFDRFLGTEEAKSI